MRAHGEKGLLTCSRLGGSKWQRRPRGRGRCSLLPESLCDHHTLPPSARLASGLQCGPAPESPAQNVINSGLPAAERPSLVLVFKQVAHTWSKREAADSLRNRLPHQWPLLIMPFIRPENFYAHIRQHRNVLFSFSPSPISHPSFFSMAAQYSI